MRNDTLTGRVRLQHRRRLILPPLIVVQVERKVWEDYNGPAGVECELRVIWEDATMEDLGALNQSLLWSAP